MQKAFSLSSVGQYLGFAGSNPFVGSMDLFQKDLFLAFRGFETFDSKKNRKWIYGNSKKVRCEKSGEISRNLRFSRSDLNRPKDLAGAEGIEPSARGFGDRCSTC